MDREKNFGLGKGFFELISYGSLLRLAFFALCFFVVVFSMTSCIVGATGTIQECGGSNQPCCGGSGGLCWQGSCGAGGICGFNCGGLNQYCCSDSIIFPRGSYGGSFYCGDGNVCWNWLLDFRWRYWLPICLGCGQYEGDFCCPGAVKCPSGLSCINHPDYPNGICVHCGLGGEPCCMSGTDCFEGECSTQNSLWGTVGVCEDCGYSGQSCCKNSNGGGYCLDGSVCGRLGTCDPAGTCGTPPDQGCCWGGYCFGGNCADRGFICRNAPCGGNSQPCCTNSTDGCYCKPGFVLGYDSPVCRSCGGLAQLCCETPPYCNEGYCDENVQVGGSCLLNPSGCGRASELCCPGNICFSGLTCNLDGWCRGDCGGLGQACCLGGICREGYCDGQICRPSCTAPGVPPGCICGASGMACCPEVPPFCISGLECDGLFCGCTNECNNGERRCDPGGSEGYEVCGDYNLDGCYEWGPLTSCVSSRQICNHGTGVCECNNKCSFEGDKECSGGTTYHFCEADISAGCLDWGSNVSCPTGKVCNPITKECECGPPCAPNTKQCTSSTTYQTCVNVIGCWTWGSEASCLGGKVCDPITKECVASTFTNECTPGNPTCSGTDQVGCLLGGDGYYDINTISCLPGICVGGVCTGGCNAGQTQFCPLQKGVCEGAQQTCTGGVWPGCTSETYFNDNCNYQETETNCLDGLDNDCDGLVNEECDGCFLYQETANATDGCNGVNTGSYSCDNSWWGGNCRNLYDGVWTTLAEAAGPTSGMSYYNVTYSVPSNMNPYKLELRYEDIGGDDFYENVTNLQRCINSGKVHFSFRIDSVQVIAELYCYNQSGKWDRLTELLSDEEVVRLYEEGIWWNCSSAEPVQTCQNNVREGTEVCDGNQFGGVTCATFGFTGGNLICNSTCSGINTTNCTSGGGGGGGGETCHINYYDIIFPCFDQDGNPSSCVVSSCDQVNQVNRSLAEKEDICLNCTTSFAIGGCVWMDNYCYKPSPDTANCVQNISWKGACNPGDETYDMVYSWINTVTKEYYRGCDKEGCTAAGCLLKMPCPSVMKLSFFDLKNIAITVMLLIAVYFVYATARRK